MTLTVEEALFRLRRVTADATALRRRAVQALAERDAAEEALTKARAAEAAADAEVDPAWVDLKNAIWREARFGPSAGSTTGGTTT